MANTSAQTPHDATGPTLLGTSQWSDEDLRAYELTAYQSASERLVQLAQRSRDSGIPIHPLTRWSDVVVPWLWLAAEETASNRFSEALAEFAGDSFDEFTNSRCAAFIRQMWQESQFAFRALGIGSAAHFQDWLRREHNNMLLWMASDSRFTNPGLLATARAHPAPPGLGRYIQDYQQEYTIHMLANTGTAQGLGGGLASVLRMIVSHMAQALHLPPTHAGVVHPTTGAAINGLGPGRNQNPNASGGDLRPGTSQPVPDAPMSQSSPAVDGAGHIASPDVFMPAAPEPVSEPAYIAVDTDSDEDIAGVQSPTHDLVIPMPAPDIVGGNGWPVIDEVSIMDCLVSPFAHLDDVPTEHAEGWALAMVDILDYLDRAGNDAELTRALKWLTVLHDVLLRLPPRGGRRGHTYVSQRFAAWSRGDYAKVLSWWKQDRQAAGHPTNQRRHPANDVERALHLISEGELSKAVHLLTSNGLGDLSDARIVEQLRAKHPPRKEALPPSLEGFAPFGEINVSLEPTFRNLRKQAGTGVSGFRNEYLTALTANFADERARQAIPLMEALAHRYVNAQLPDWYYLAATTVKQMAPIKEPASSRDAPPDVRPIGIGECLIRAIHTSVATQYKEAFGAYLWPQQVAVGVPGGLSLLVVGVTLALELHPDWVAVKIDLRNAYNELKRAAILARLDAAETLRDLVPLTWATCSGAPEIYLAHDGNTPAGYSSAEGARQGDPMASGQFCTAIHPEVCQLDSELSAAAGGFAKFDMDDGYAVGPPAAVFPAVLRFAARAQTLGLEMQLHKCKCFSPTVDLLNHPARPPMVQVGRVTLADGHEARGITVGGVPLGEERFVSHHLSCKVDVMLSNMSIITSKLRDRHLQALWSVTYHCIQHQFQYWVQHCSPEVVLPMATRADEALLGVARCCISDNLGRDALSLGRLRLPARRYGAGLRSLAQLAPAAFLGTLCRTVPLLADRVVSGRLVAGFMPLLTQALEVDPAVGNDPLMRIQAFSQTRSALAAAFHTAWDQILGETRNLGEESLAEVFCRAARQGKGVQHALTSFREKARFQALDVELRGLAATDMRKAAWLNVDRFSTVWVSAWPTEDLQFSSPEFREMSTFYFGLPSPACAAHVGEPIANRRTTLDAYGTRLTTLTLPGDGWRTQHDAIKWRLVQDAREMSFRLREEVYGLFAACIPQAGRAQADGMHLRKRQGLVPDFLVHAALDGPERPLLFELKTLHYGSSTYTPAEARCHAVATRASALPAEYTNKARMVDRRFCNTSTGDVGPVEAKLRTFEPVRGIVFGAWGEASPVVSKLLTLMAKSGALRHWRSMRCSDPAHAVGVVAWLLRRRWGLTALRENARLKLDRLTHVGHGAVAASRRRDMACEAHAARMRTTAGQLISGPRARAAERHWRL